MKNSFDSFVKACFEEGATVANLRSIRKAALPHRQWEVGCAIYIPADFNVLLQRFGGERTAAFIPVQVEFPDGMVVNDKLFLAQFTKCVQGSDAEGVRFYDYARGTANQLAHDCADWAEFLNSITGKTLRIAAVRTHNVRDNFSGWTTPKSVYDIDLA